jgi:hypothetical protein
MNGNFNRFNVADSAFSDPNYRVLANDANLGNVEAEFDSPADEAGCGYAYPDSVDEAIVGSLVKVDRAADRLVRFAELPTAQDLFIAGESRRTAVGAQALPDIEPQHRRASVNGDRLRFDVLRFAQRSGGLAQTRGPLDFSAKSDGSPLPAEQAFGTGPNEWTLASACRILGSCCSANRPQRGLFT